MKKRHAYNLHHSVMTQGQLFQLVPFMKLDIAPGDSMSGKLGMMLRFQPFWKSLLHDLIVDTFLFYVPWRLVDANWEDFLSAGPIPAAPIPLPTSNLSDPMLFMPRYSALGQLQPTGVAGAGTGNKALLAYYRYGFNLIWNEYFRDQQNQAPIAANSYTDLFANSRRQYWNEIRVDQQIGDVAMAPVVGSEVSAQDILRAIALQKQMVKRATYGTRYIDILRSYGVNITVAMLQRPELVARGSSLVNITDIVSTNATTESAGQDLGLLSGYGVHGHRIRFRRKSFNEHGCLYGICVVRPPQFDPTVGDWMDTRIEPDYSDFYDPALELLPQKQVIAQDPFMYVANAPNNVIGYMPHFEWLRGAVSRAHQGLFLQPRLTDTVTGQTYNSPWGGYYGIPQFIQTGFTVDSATDLATPTPPEFWTAPPPTAVSFLRGSQVGGNNYWKASLPSEPLGLPAFISPNNPYNFYQVGAINGVRAIRLVAPGNPGLSSGAT